MSELKATPGPYELEVHANGCVFITSEHIPASKGDLADLYHTFPNRENPEDEKVRIITKENAVNNGHLLAASWEMYDALKAITDCYGSGLPVEKFIEAVDDFMMEGRAALAKARGEQS